MITLADFKNWIKTAVKDFDNYYVGMINDATKEKQLGIYHMDIDTPKMIPIGGKNNKKYSHKDIKLLVHGTKGATSTEKLAYDTYNALDIESDFEIGNTKVNFIELLNEDPIYVGIDDNNIFEYVIRLRIHFKI